MPRNGSGSYTLPKPAFVPNTTISSADVNSDFSDIATAITGSIAADGQTPITAPLGMPSGTAAAPGVTFASDMTSGMYLGTHGPGISGGGIALVLFNDDRTGVGQDGAILTYGDGTILAPVGIVSSYAGATAPDGWLLTYGQAVSRTDYPELFHVIGTTYGSGDGSTTFNLPDGRGRVDIGKDNMGGSAANRVTTAGSGVDGVTLGAVGGTQGISLTTAQLAAHAHTATSTDAGHTHTYSYYFGNQNSAPGGGSLGTFATSGTTATGFASITTTVNNAGSGDAHFNVQPGIVYNKIIFTGRVV